MRRYGRWEVRGTLGSGGMGQVFRAVDPSTRRWAAVKVAKVRRAARDALRAEIAALERLSHPGIVKVLEHGTEGDELWVATELVAGLPLRDRVASSHASSSGAVDTVLLEDPTSVDAVYGEGAARRAWSLAELRDALAVVRRLCDPLAWLHGEGFVHGDVKPENILVRPDGRVVLVDLGLTRAFDLEGRDTLAVERRISGTVGYLSPEQCQGRPPDGRSDLYALGCVLFEILCGSPPFGHGAAARWSHVAVPAPSVREWCDVPNEVDELVARLLEKEPRRRLAYATDVAEWLEGLGIPAPADPGPPARRALYRPPLVGRREVVDALRGQRVAAIEGEPGTGKTRLLAALAEDREVPSVVGLGSAPGGVAASLVSSLVSLVPDDRASRWFGHAPLVLAALDPRVAELLGEPRASDANPPDGAVRAAVEQALAAAAPVRVLLDELDPLDPRDEALCLRLARRPPDGVTVAVAGPPPALRAALAAAGAPIVALGPLDDAAIDELLKEALGDDEPPPELLAFLRARAAGNPRLAFEYTRELVAIGELRRRRGRWLVRDRDRLDATPAPAGVEGLARARFEALTPALRTAAGRAAIAGFDAVSDAERAGLAEARVAERVPGWRFVAPVLADLARAALSPEDRAAAHRAALDALPPDAPAERRAAHLAGAGDVDAARAAWLAVIHAASRATRWAAVVRACTAAAALPGTPPAADAAIRVALATAHRARGHFRDAVAVLEGLDDDLSTPLGRDVRFHRARALARTPDSATGLALLEDAVARQPEEPRWLEALAETCAERGDLPASLAARRTLVAILAARGDEPVRLARSRIALSNVLQRQDRVLEARALVAEALPVLEADGDPIWLGHGHAARSLAWSTADEDVAKADALAAIRHYRAAGYVANETQALGVLVDCLRRRREFGEALAWMPRMEALADEVGSDRLRAQAAFTRAAILFALRDPAALENLLRVLPSLRSAGYTQGEGLGSGWAATLLREAGRWDEAAPHLDRLTALAAQRDDVGLVFYDAIERAFHAAHAGRGVEAAMEAVRAAEAQQERLDEDDHALLAQLAAAVARAG